MAQAVAQAPEAAGQGLEAAHRALLQRRDLQFDFPPFERVTREPPDWLTALMTFLGRLFAGAAPVLQILFWGVVILVVLGLVYLVARELGWLERVKKKRKRGFTPADYRPDADTAHALMADADALAAQGRYAEAVHILLLRSIDDMRRWRPRAIQPAATSRDIARLDALPADARPAFASMAQMVEASLFGGRPVDVDGFSKCRGDYEAFAFPKVWA